MVKFVFPSCGCGQRPVPQPVPQPEPEPVPQPTGQE